MYAVQYCEATNIYDQPNFIYEKSLKTIVKKAEIQKNCLNQYYT